MSKGAMRPGRESELSSLGPLKDHTSTFYKNIEPLRKTVKTTIAINLGHKFVAIEAETIEILQIPLALHTRPGHNTWNITDPRSGFALTTNKPTREAARFDVVIKIGTAGRDKVLSLIGAAPAAPAVETLQSYEAPVKPTAPTINVAAICETLAEKSGVDIAIIRRVISSKGKNAGRLLAACPPVFGPKKDPAAAAVWLGLQPNPFKVSVGKVLFLDKENQELTLRLGKIKWPAWLDADKAALVSFGVW